jgi:ATP-dependent DNA ligase
MIINRPKFKEVTYEDALRKTSARMDYDVVEPKMDGIWGAMHIKHGKYQIWSRTGKLKKEGRADESGQEMCILGEFMHGSHWGKKNDIDGKFYAFDMVQCNGDWGFSDEPLRNRRKRLNNYWEMGGYFPKFVLINEQWNIESWNEMWKARVEKQGFEGVILKNTNESYMEATWCKIKARADIDYVCMGFGDGHEGTKYENTVGSIHGGLYNRRGELIDVCHVGGLNEVQRDFFNKHRDYFKGKVFTAHGYQIFESGAIRHGKFKNFRTDKERHSCDFSQVPIHSRGETH